MTSIQLDFLHADKQKHMTLPLKAAIKTLRDGKPILLLDSDDREGEGDLVIAAEKIDSSGMNFIIKKGSGVVCLALSEEKRQQLALPMMVPDNTNRFQTGFTVSIEALTGVSTGVSASDRAHTIRLAMAEDAKPSDLRRPGHVFPLAARINGVFERMGHTEGSIDLMKIADLMPGAVLCELMNADGSMAVAKESRAFAHEHDIPVITVEEILFYRIKTEDIIENHFSKKIETRFGPLVWHSFSFLSQNQISILTKDNENTGPICIVDSTNMSNRFISMMLGNHDDDPLYNALDQLKQNNNIIALLPGLERRPLSSDEERRNFAFLCRALKELSIKNLRLLQDNLGFGIIAQQHFDLSVNSN